jgi:hypothetical protein
MTSAPLQHYAARRDESSFHNRVGKRETLSEFRDLDDFSVLNHANEEHRIRVQAQRSNA